MNDNDPRARFMRMSLSAMCPDPDVELVKNLRSNQEETPSADHDKIKIEKSADTNSDTCPVRSWSIDREQRERVHSSSEA